jgi:uncharacterized protein
VKSCIYTGQLSHLRLLPRLHEFRYSVFMMYLDLDELDQVFSLSWLWSLRRWAPARWRRSDFLGAPAQGLKSSVMDHIFQQTGRRFEGSVRILANLRYFGFIMNPLVVYYCFATDRQGEEKLQFIVAEVTNTPWREKHAYVLQCNPHLPEQRINFEKTLHVSPFNTMDMHYRWRSNDPGRNLFLQLSSIQEGEKIFEAHLALRRQEITARSLRSTILSYPAMTLKVCAAIYWQALKLYLKGIKFVSHPDSRPRTDDV